MQRNISRIAIAIIALALAAPAAAQTAVKIHDILRSPRQYSEHDVAVFGHIRELAVGPQYTTFRICGARCLNVLAWGHPRISDGQALSVRGRFHEVKEIDHHKVRNLVEVEHGAL
ncbi:MAG TPA: hypothetical protein VKB84_20130 [Candidatus Binataceae bacterium]|jgi:hypothetical protein|nr:hypothetical protein [Candidatus Binataceae bacterium]